MHLSVISNPTSPPDQLSSELEPMSLSEDEDLANNNECSTADTAAEHSSISGSSSTTDSDLSSNVNFGFYQNGNLNDLSSGDTEETEELIRKAAQALLDRTPLRARQLAPSRSLHSIRNHIQPQPLPPTDYSRQRPCNEREEIRQRLAMLDIDDGDLLIPRTSESSPEDIKVEAKAAEVRPPRKSRVQRPTSFPCRRKPIRLGCMTPICTDDQSFSARKTRLMAEARLALAQAPEVARRELSRQRELRALQRRSAVASLLLPPGARRFTRPVLSKMSVAKLQLILSDLQSQVERLNEELVKSLLQRDELNMERDGKLVDIEDLDRIEPDCNTSLLSTLVTTM
ncbi:uncharacterized protein LOC111269458 isoform X1 [Varroa jacobsoni]|uniref:Schwannomin interacting protein 1 C-terminal domain-containing protein n=1 Tax=Varroa destructor TaxID=109461 RepID=A0A7M7J366_VARDE|nr:uncharacterized protein LOC111242798 isoform X2 [Varroa destructor]XP_022704802.1 uncharacterized protein LOC111269458 isoform X1 [Varroa jacobsoni]XP_022704803.1 uncharacterized protein LOC111269458 isoform X1 [Varroa jacobsoni]